MDCDQNGVGSDADNGVPAQHASPDYCTVVASRENAAYAVDMESYHNTSEEETHHEMVKTVKNNSNKTSHMFECDECSKKSISRHSLFNHKQFHRLGPFKCEICGQSFGLQSTLYNHRNKHHNMPYICAMPNCNYSCKSWGAYL